MREGDLLDGKLGTKVFDVQPVVATRQHLFEDRMAVALLVGRGDGELQAVGAGRGGLIGQRVANAEPLACGNRHLPLGVQYVAVGKGQHHQSRAILLAHPAFAERHKAARVVGPIRIRRPVGGPRCCCRTGRATRTGDSHPCPRPGQPTDETVQATRRTTGSGAADIHATTRMPTATSRCCRRASGIAHTLMIGFLSPSKQLVTPM